MAIVEMKRMSLLAMNADRDKLLDILQKAGCVQVTEIDREGAAAYRPQEREGLASAEEKLSRIRWTIGQLASFQPKVGMLQQMSMPEVTGEEAAEIAAAQAELMAVVEAVEGVERRRGELRGAEARMHTEKELLTPWLGLDIPMESIAETRATLQITGSVAKRALDGLQSAFAALPVRMDVVGEAKDSAYLWIVAHRSAQEAVQGALKAADFTPVQFSGVTGTPEKRLAELEGQLAQLVADRERLSEELAALGGEAPRLKVLYEVISCECERLLAGSRVARTASAFLLEGWTPGSLCAKVEKKIRAVAPDCEIGFRDATDDEKPPTLLNNHRVVAPFEAVIANYSLPDSRGLDPTFIMAPFFACFFGMMVSDAGYGLIMAIAIPLIIHFVKPKTGLRRIMWVLGIGGFFTVFWGAMFDTWFGASVKPILINPLEQPLEMMGLCLGLGVVHLFTGLAIAAYKNFKAGRPLDALFDQLLWFVLLIGIGLMILPATAGVGGVMAIGGAAGILLTAGRSKPGIARKFIGGFGALYGITSWLSDILSYMRLFGMGLATGVIGMVFNMLAGLVFGNGVVGVVFGVLILVVGHAFNMAINVLGAYVHACRLQYIEFFGKFYDDGGTPFSPLAQTPRYIAIRPSDADGV